jgi:hypothetical protein
MSAPLSVFSQANIKQKRDQNEKEEVDVFIQQYRDYLLKKIIENSDASMYAVEDPEDKFYSYFPNYGTVFDYNKLAWETIKEDLKGEYTFAEEVITLPSEPSRWQYFFYSIGFASLPKPARFTVHYLTLLERVSQSDTKSS